MNDLSTLLGLLSPSQSPVNRNPKQSPEQFQKLQQIEQLTSNELETRPENIKLMARLLRSATQDQTEQPLEMHELETFSYWLESEVNLLSQIRFMNSEANYHLTEHFKAGGDDFSRDQEVSPNVHNEIGGK